MVDMRRGGSASADLFERFPLATRPLSAHLRKLARPAAESEIRGSYCQFKRVLKEALFELARREEARRSLDGGAYSGFVGGDRR
ncbi:hypothetical protein A8B73_02420 [Methylosinus sp. 3S-1]|nr:hypothetical protein A8B73_02420 [Methylosinus sp. 3S-1]